ncbi:hypothetical protein BD414DRAFT_511133 [Trametes punicea]|nr:hypothetical protein BD414DRAFT_511133 [Trametes punicea]
MSPSDSSHSRLSVPSVQFIPYEPPHTDAGTTPHPVSKYWMKRPAWIDRVLKEPQFYYDHEEIDSLWKLQGLASAAGLLALRDGHMPLPADPSAHIDPVPASQSSLEAPLLPSHGPDSLEVHPLVPDTPPQLTELTAALATTHTATPDEYLITASMYYTELTKGPATRGSKLQSKTTHVTKMARAAICPHSGPSFKMWWMGITKTNAGTVETDEEFAVTLDAVLKKRGCSGVSVESTFDSLAGFRVRKRALAAMGVVDCNDEDELSHDTKVVVSLQPYWWSTHR